MSGQSWSHKLNGIDSIGVDSISSDLIKTTLLQCHVMYDKVHI